MGPRRDWRGYSQAGRGEGWPSTLQWGHAVIGVDTGPQALQALQLPLASMGPRRDWRGYCCRRATSGAPESCFNGATP